GFKGVHLITGHYAQGHEVVLYDIAEKLTSEGFPVVASSPLEVLEDEDLLDHAGKWETAQYAIIEGESAVRLDTLPEELIASKHAVLGPHPKEYDLLATGLLLRKALLKWAEMPGLNLQQYYQRRRESYDGYRSRYFRDSWEQAIQDWWNSQSKV